MNLKELQSYPAYFCQDHCHAIFHTGHPTLGMTKESDLQNDALA